MTAAYRLLPSPMKGVVRTADGALIPENTSNRDWIAYQKWLAVPNTPDPAVTPAKPIRITSGDFFYRFTDDEKLAVQAACNASAALGVGLTNGLALGYVILTDAVVGTWMDGLVSANAISSQRKTEILTP